MPTDATSTTPNTLAERIAPRSPAEIADARHQLEDAPTLDPFALGGDQSEDGDVVSWSFSLIDPETPLHLFLASGAFRARR